MHRIVYASVAVAPVQRALLDIVRASERNNSLLGCSGMLLHGPRGYKQLIEGPRGPLETLYATIESDGRHRVSWMKSEAIAARSIPLALPMGYVGEDELQRDPALRRAAAALAACTAADDAEQLSAALAVAAHVKYPALTRTA